MTATKSTSAILIMGATAAGKTDLALQLSSYLPIEIISVDATAVYKGLDIGSAKPNKKELATCPHHLIDIKSPLESYSVAQFFNHTQQLIIAINNRNKIPVLVGGTMMYYHAIINGLHQLPSDHNIKSKLLADADAYSLDYLYQQLKSIDPESASNISSNDKQRVIRKLELCLLLNAPISQWLKQKPTTYQLDNCNLLKFIIKPEDRNLLYYQAEERFEKMIANGLIKEVSNLCKLYPQLNLNYNSIRSVGYKQVWQFLNNELSYQDMINKAKTATKNLVKRQYTWLKNFEGEIIISVDQIVKRIIANKKL